MNNEIIGRIYRALLREYNRHADVTNFNDEYDEEKLQATTNKISQLCADFPWLRELGKDILIKK